MRKISKTRLRKRVETILSKFIELQELDSDGMVGKYGLDYNRVIGALMKVINELYVG